MPRAAYHFIVSHRRSSYCCFLLRLLRTLYFILNSGRGTRTFIVFNCRIPVFMLPCCKKKFPLEAQ